METSTATPTPPATRVTGAGRAVPTRRVSFEESLADLPRHYAANGDLILSHFFATLSSVFPDGEEFFVRSVRHHRDLVTEPVLRRQVAGHNIRVGAIAPGMVANELWGFTDPAGIAEMVEKHASLTSEDVAEAVIFMLSRPPHVTIRDLVMLPQNQDL